MKRTLVMLALVLAGCVQQPAKDQQMVAEQPVSEQKPTTDARGRAKAHTELGMVYLQGGQLGIALDEARVALSSDSDYAPAYNLLGLVHMYLQDNAAAQSNFERALRLAPNDPEIKNSYASLLCQTGRESEAMSLFLAAARNPLYQTPTIPYTNAGRCALLMKDDKAAEENFRRAIQVDQSNVLAVYELAEVYYRRGSYIEAKRLLTEMHRLSDPSAASLWLALRTERKLGNRADEASLNLELRRKFPGTPEHQAMMQGNYE